MKLHSSNLSMQLITDIQNGNSELLHDITTWSSQVFDHFFPFTMSSGSKRFWKLINRTNKKQICPRVSPFPWEENCNIFLSIMSRLCPQSLQRAVSPWTLKPTLPLSSPLLSTKFFLNNEDRYVILINHQSPLKIHQYHEEHQKERYSYYQRKKVKQNSIVTVAKNFKKIPSQLEPFHKMHLGQLGQPSLPMSALPQAVDSSVSYGSLYLIQMDKKILQYPLRNGSNLFKMLKEYLMGRQIRPKLALGRSGNQDEARNRTCHTKSPLWRIKG